MPQEIIDYIHTEKVGVLATMRLDGSPHAAAIHFAHNTDPLVFYFETDKSSIKVERIMQKGTSKASFVLADQVSMKTLQLDGDISLINDQLIKDIFFEKFPNRLPKYNPEKDIFLIFTPTWWRFTDFKAPGGKLVLTS